ncbi:hypothetical protein, partial [Sutterella sp.]|uniref:hypothetical protein n=1 Tax=Sutterella sp. TaxID=1981025 RepID=UPI0026DEBE6A
MANDTFDAIRSRFSKDSLENGPRRVNQIMLLIILGFSGAAVITAGLFMSADSGEKETDPASVVQNDLTLHPERAQRQAFISQQEARLDNVEKQLRNIQSA